MWTKKEQDRFDATVWKGPTDVTGAAMRLAILIGLGIFWFAFFYLIFFST